MEQQLTRQPAPPANRGFALVLVLCALVLLTVLVVAYLSSVGSELQSSKTYASSAYTRQLADLASNLVIAQIKEATTTGTNKIWTSQPGLIRTYNTDGTLDKYYKLYSANQWRASGSFNPTTDVPSDWSQRPADYTDLNSPVVDSSGSSSFPIIDGNAIKSLTKNTAGATKPAYLGYDSDGDGVPDMDGFSIDPSKVTYNNDPTKLSGTNNPVPMPVQWMYLLNNGDINTASAASGTNPIVARIAFWTDDETSKVNVNTASEGTFWETPILAGPDTNYSDSPVQAKEYQRYPGHPAATSLSAILTSQLSSPTDTNATGDLRNFIFGMVPRVSGRGSQAGTRAGLTTNSLPVTPDHDRLYDSVDELAFLPELTGTGTRYDMTSANLQTLRSSQLDWKFSGVTMNSGTSGSPYAFSQVIKIDEKAVPKLRFFLTTQSRAPELNLLNRPRISLWPIDTRSDYISPTDKTIAFCTTIGGKQYYFQRQNPKSPTEDFTNIARNGVLYSYLQTILNNPIPGFGNTTFSTKYSGGQSDQILTEIFDWIRSGVNLAYPSTTVNQYAFYPNTSAVGTISPPGLPGSGQVVPIKINNTKGFGRFATISKIAYELVMENRQIDTVANTTTFTMRFAMLFETFVPMMGYAGYVPDYTIAINGLGNGPTIHLYDVTNQTATDQAIAADTLDGTIRMDVPSNVEPFFGRAWGGMQGFFTPFFYLDSSNQVQPRTLHSTDSVSGYPFASSSGKLKFTVSGTSAATLANKRIGIDNFGFTLKIMDNDPAGPNVVQTLQPSFPAVTGLALPLMSGTTGPPVDSSQDSPDLQERVNQVCAVSVINPSGGNTEWDNRVGKSILVSGSFTGTGTTGGDIVRGLELSHGDLRLLAVRSAESATTSFVPHVSYSGTVAMAHSLLRPSGAIEGMEIVDAKENVKSTHIPKRGVLVPGTLFISSSVDYHPQATSGTNLQAFVKLNGDFTTALTTEGDGPLIMKPDEGNAGMNVGYNFGQSELYPYRNQLFPWNVTNLANTFSPNRQVASAVQLGTLPSGAVASGGATEKPWQTLLFRPNFNTNAHPGSASPEDHLLLDLFWMPVVDPYPISEPFSTAGKINMNYQIMPFSYIRRDTGMRAALKSTKLLAVMPVDDQNKFSSYKWGGTSFTKNPTPSSIYDVDVNQTLLFFDERFADNTQQAFKSASEICDIPLVPKQMANSAIGTGHPDNIPVLQQGAAIDLYDAPDAASLRPLLQQFWQKASLSGDNMIEATYNHLYPRLTTKSNTYTVHVRVQALKKVKGTPANAFLDPNDTNTNGLKDIITGEYRGSFVIERYIDPNDSRFKATDPAHVDPDTDSLDQMYKFRVLNTKQFTP